MTNALLSPRMQRASMIGLAVLVVAFFSPSAAAISVSSLSDGATLIALPVHGPESGAEQIETVALVVATGAAHDPDGKEGLAFLTAHAATNGTAIDDRNLAEALRETKGTLEIRVGMFTTAFIVSAPASGLKNALTTMAKHISNPYLHGVDLGRARAVAARLEEGAPAGPVDAQIDQLLFPSVNRGRLPTGRGPSRSAIDGDDVQAFFAKHYVSGAMTWVSATTLAPKEQEDVLEGALAFPPIAQPPPVQERARPNVPSEVELVGERPEATMIYRLSDQVTTSGCRTAALALEVTAQDVFGFGHDGDERGSVHASCRLTRGEHLLVFRVQAPQNGSSDVVPRMKEVLRTVAGRPVQRKHRAAFRRLAARRSLAGNRTPSEAVAFVTALLEHDERRPASVIRAYQQPLVRGAKVRKVTKRLLDAKKRAVIDVSMGMRRNRARNR